MKKLLSALLAIVMLCSLAACSPQQNGSSSETSVISQTEAQSAEASSEAAQEEKPQWVDYVEYSLEEDVPVENIILMIGDGMGNMR